MPKTPRRAWIAALLLMGLTGACQRWTEGEIVVVVTDAAGKRVSGAIVTVLNPANNTSIGTHAAVDGEYRAASLPVGDYAVVVSKAGYRTARADRVHVNGGASSRVAVSLTPHSGL